MTVYRPSASESAETTVRIYRSDAAHALLVTALEIFHSRDGVGAAMAYRAIAQSDAASLPGPHSA